jgi:hypothetical protein
MRKIAVTTACIFEGPSILIQFTSTQLFPLTSHTLSSRQLKSDHSNSHHSTFISFSSN